MTDWDWNYLWPMFLAWGLVVVLGSVVSFYAFRLYLRGQQRSVGLLAFGFAFLSAAAGFTWFGLYVAGMGLFYCELGSTSFMVAGFASILLSLRTVT